MKKIYFIFNKKIHEEELHSSCDIKRWFVFLVCGKPVVIKKIYASLGEAEQALKQKKLTKKKEKMTMKKCECGSYLAQRAVFKKFICECEKQKN